jgi:hypothetical protein
MSWHSVYVHADLSEQAHPDPVVLFALLDIVSNIFERVRRIENLPILFDRQDVAASSGEAAGIYALEERVALGKWIWRLDKLMEFIGCPSPRLQGWPEEIEEALEHALSRMYESLGEAFAEAGRVAGLLGKDLEEVLWGCCRYYLLGASSPQLSWPELEIVLQPIAKAFADAEEKDEEGDDAWWEIIRGVLWYRYMPLHSEEDGEAVLASAARGHDDEHQAPPSPRPDNQIEHHHAEPTYGAEEPLSQDQRDFLVAALELGAVDSDSRRTAEEIVRKAKGDYADPPNAKRALSNLVRARGLLCSTTGKQGGYWLTAVGRARAERIKQC